MIKYNKLKQRMIKEGSIALGALLLLCGLAFGLSSYENSLSEEFQISNNSVSMLSGQISEIESKKIKISQSIEPYRELKKRIENKEFSLDPIMAQEKLNEIRKDFQLNEPSVTIDEKKELTGASYDKYPTAVASYRSVEVDFVALTDLHVYSFINALKNNFPGLIHIYEVRINRDKEVDNSVIRNIVLEGIEPSLIKGNIKFYWIGFGLKKDQVENGAPTNGG
jgi:hypothetical protein